ncbi:MAG: hypothetical protein ABSD56_03875 [Bryobacteraceae bacterium]
MRFPTAEAVEVMVGAASEGALTGQPDRITAATVWQGERQAHGDE